MMDNAATRTEVSMVIASLKRYDTTKTTIQQVELGLEGDELCTKRSVRNGTERDDEKARGGRAPETRDSGT